jgi:hypothetical protein
MTDWELEDVEATARAFPSSFFIPSRNERCAQAVGDEVRLHFVLTADGPDLPRAERMWVEIVDLDGDPPSYVGCLANQPLHISSLKVGDRVTFGPEHIAQTFIRRTDPRWFEAAELEAIVSRKVFEEGEEIRWIYRQESDRSEDSGWRVFTGHETQEYIDDASNSRICLVGWLIDFDPTLLPAMRADVGSAFERESASDAWVEVTDWEPPAD